VFKSFQILKLNILIKHSTLMSSKREFLINGVDEIILDIMEGDGDVFIDEEIREYGENKKVISLTKLEDLQKHVMYIRDQIQFAILLQAFLVGLVKLFRPGQSAEFNKLTGDKFISKHKNFIEQAWYWIVYWNLWNLIKFCAGMLVAFVQSSST
jgi:hypothetical protein